MVLVWMADPKSEGVGQQHTAVYVFGVGSLFVTRHPRHKSASATPSAAATSVGLIR